MGRRIPLLLLAAGLVALLFHFLADVGSDGGAREPARSARGDTGAIGGGAALTGVDDEPAPAARRDVDGVDRSSTTDAVERASDAAAPDAAPTAAPPTEGRLVVLDPAFGPRTQESGVIVAFPWRAKGPSKPARLVVESGRFDGSALVRDAYRIDEATMESPSGPREVLFDEIVFEVRPGKEILLQGRYTPRRTLRVLDASTGRDLDGVGVLEVDPEHDPGATARHPGLHFDSQFEQRVSGATSPLTLPTARGVKEYWVTAKDHAWGRITVDHEVAGESVVRLGRGGSLLVEVTGHSAHVNNGGSCMLAVDEPSGASVVVARLGAGSDEPAVQRFHGVPAGPVDVRVAAGGQRGALDIVGSASVVVPPGGEAVARIDVDRLAFARPVPLRVAIDGAQDLLQEVSALSIRPADGVIRYRTDVRDVPRRVMGGGSSGEPLIRGVDRLSPGRYLFVVAPMMQIEAVEVLDRSDEDAHIDDEDRPPQEVRIRLEERRRLRVRAIDALGGAPIEFAVVAWGPAADPPLDPVVRSEAEIELPNAGVDLFLADGVYRITASAPFHAPTTETVRIASGRQEIALALAPLQRREVELFVGDARRPWPDGATCEVGRRGAAVPDAIHEAEDGALFIGAGRPGLYDLSIRGLRHGDDDGSLDVAIEVDESGPLRVSLTR